MGLIESHKFFAHTQVRTSHLGHMRAVGYCDRIRNSFKGSVALKRLSVFENFVKQVQGMPFLDELGAALLQLQISGAFPNLQLREPLLRSDIAAVKAVNFFFTKNYQARALCEQGIGFYHGPPPQLAKALKMQPCTEACGSCRVSCDTCPHCMLHKDVRDRTCTLLLLHQDEHVPADHRAYFVIDEQSYPIIGTMAFFFNAASSMHGVYSKMVQAIPDSSAWYGCAMVRRFLIQGDDRSDRLMDRGMDWTPFGIRLGDPAGGVSAGSVMDHQSVDALQT